MDERDAHFFASVVEFRSWLEQHHESATEAWIGFWKKASGRGGLTYAESVDEGLCFGWIDGLTRTIDAERYAIRFTPRRKGSNWSEVNIRRVAELTAEGRMTAAGQRAFELRRPPAPGTYTYETRPADLPDEYAGIFRRNDAAWQFWSAQRASYRKSMTWWVVQAKRDDTRLRRLDALIAESAAGRVIDELNMPKLGQRRNDG